jgi:hypothetical protein
MSPENPERYPFKKVGAAREASREMLRSLERPEAAQGEGKAPRRPPAAFLQREVEEAPEDRLRDDAQISRWLHAHAESGASSRTVTEEMIERARRHPSRRSFERIRSVLLEVGRRRGGGKRLRELVTQEVVDELIGKEG